MKRIFKKFLLLIVLLGGFLFVSCEGKEQILIYASSEEERIVYIQEELNKQFPNYNIIVQYQGTSALVSKLQGEGQKTDCDIIFELEANNMELLLSQNENFFADLSDYDFSKFTSTAIEYGHKKYAPTCMTYGSVIINNKVLKDNNLEVPKTYEDLLKPQYKGLISMPNPKSSGTGYLFYNGLVSVLGEKEALKYFNELSENVTEFTSSGAAPLKAANRGEVAIALGMLWQTIMYSKENSNLTFTFLNHGAPSNLYCMTMIKGHEERQPVKEVFDYIFNTLNKKTVEKFIPDPIYNDYTPEDSTYPTNIPAIIMNGLFDPIYKQNLLDKWDI